MRGKTTIAALLFTMVVYATGIRVVAADKPADASATPPATKPASIFDFGLEPLPNGEEDKPAKTDTHKPAPPAPAPESPKPATAKPAKPVEPQTSSNTPAPSATAVPISANGDLTEILKACHIDANGVLSSEQVVTLGLKGTEGKHFIISGDFNLAPEPTRFNQGGLCFHLRRKDSTHCVDLSIGGMRIKRILFEGEVVKKFAWPMKFSGADRGKWLPFKVDASDKAIVVHLADLEGIAKGPLATEGTNVIVLSPGAKLRNLKLQILE